MVQSRLSNLSVFGVGDGRSLHLNTLIKEFARKTHKNFGNFYTTEKT